MTAIDIRKDVPLPVDTIVFADDNVAFDNIIQVSARSYYGDTQVLEFWDVEQNSMRVDARDVENLIKALQKAIDLGWTK